MHFYISYVSDYVDEDKMIHQTNLIKGASNATPDVEMDDVASLTNDIGILCENGIRVPFLLSHYWCQGTVAFDEFTTNRHLTNEAHTEQYFEIYIFLIIDSIQ